MPKGRGFIRRAGDEGSWERATPAILLTPTLYRLRERGLVSARAGLSDFT